MPRWRRNTPSARRGSFSVDSAESEGASDRVAAVRGMTHPEEGIALYKKLLPHVVTGGTLRAQYGEAFEIVKAIQELRAAQKQGARFRQELAVLRTTWKLKRNFMKLLATLG